MLGHGRHRTPRRRLLATRPAATRQRGPASFVSVQALPPSRDARLMTFAVAGCVMPGARRAAKDQHHGGPGSQSPSPDLAFAGREGCARHAFRSHRSRPVPPRRRGRQHHARGRARQSGARRRLDPHPQHGAGARRRASGARPPGRDADAGRPHPARSTRAPSSPRPSACARISAPMRAASPARSGSCPTPTR